MARKQLTSTRPYVSISGYENVFQTEIREKQAADIKFKRLQDIKKLKPDIK